MISFLTRKINIQKLTASGFCSKNHQDKDSEPKGPNVKTEIPGPKSKKILEKLQIRPSFGTAELFGNYEKSAGNYLVDVDGNIFLDLNMQDAKIPLGYNFKELSRLFSDPKSLHGVSNVITLSMFPGPTCPNKMEYIIDKVSPNMPNLCLCPCETSAIQEALKSLILAYQKQRKQQQNHNFLESRNALLNRTEDLQKLSILSFKNSQHGYNPEYSNLCNTEVWKKLHITKFDWPMAYYPEYKYPLEDNYCYNDSQDRKSIAMIEDFIEKYENRDLPIAGIVIEPIQNSTNHAASENFLKKLEELTFKYGIYLMFDEIKTCCGTTGKFWAHEHSCLNCPPDILVFGGNTQISGFFHREDLCPIDNVRFFATGSISLAKILIFETIIDLMEQENLLKNVQKTGELLKSGLLELEKKYDLIHSTRGLGTLLAFDARCPSLRDNFIMKLRKKGIIVGDLGSIGISLRPALIINQQHVEIFLENLENIIKTTKSYKSKIKVLPVSNIQPPAQSPESDLEKTEKECKSAKTTYIRTLVPRKPVKLNIITDPVTEKTADKLEIKQVLVSKISNQSKALTSPKDSAVVNCDSYKNIKINVSKLQCSKDVDTKNNKNVIAAITLAPKKALLTITCKKSDSVQCGKKNENPPKDPSKDKSQKPNENSNWTLRDCDPKKQKDKKPKGGCGGCGKCGC